MKCKNDDNNDEIKNFKMHNFYIAIVNNEKNMMRYKTVFNQVFMKKKENKNLKI